MLFIKNILIKYLICADISKKSFYVCLSVIDNLQQVEVFAVVPAETNGFLLFENAPQLVSYAGYDVVENQSGIRIGKTKISKKGTSKDQKSFTYAFFNNKI